MERTPGRRRAEGGVPVETPVQTVDRFIAYVTRALSDGPHAADVEWEHQMNMLFGNEELARVTNNSAYNGVPRVKEDLLFAFEHGKFDLLKAVYLSKVIEHTTVNTLGSAVATAVAKVLKFE